MSEYDVYRRQILTYEDDPRAERVKMWICQNFIFHNYLSSDLDI